MINIIPYSKGEIVSVHSKYFIHADEKFKHTNIRKNQKVYGFAAQWQVEDDIINKLGISLIKEENYNDYFPYDFRIGDNYYDVKTSINGKTITISDREIVFAEEFNMTFICLKHRPDLCDDKFEFLSAISFKKLLENNMLCESKYDDGYYVFISDLK